MSKAWSFWASVILSFRQNKRTEKFLLYANRIHRLKFASVAGCFYCRFCLYIKGTAGKCIACKNTFWKGCKIVVFWAIWNDNFCKAAVSHESFCDDFFYWFCKSYLCKFWGFPSADICTSFFKFQFFNTFRFYIRITMWIWILAVKNPVFTYSQGFNSVDFYGRVIKTNAPRKINLSACLWKSTVYFGISFDVIISNIRFYTKIKWSCCGSCKLGFRALIWNEAYNFISFWNYDFFYIVTNF